jgi:Helix-turn-helix domain
MTQVDRLYAYLRTHPGASSLDIVRDCGIVNTTGRISELRQAGHPVLVERVDGVYRYRLLKEPVQLGAWG